MARRAFIVAGFTTLWLLSQSLQAADPSALAKFIVIQLDEAKERLSHCTYSLHYEYQQSNPGSAHTLIDGEWRQAGVQRWFDFRCHAERADIGTHDTRQITFLGLKSAGYYVTGMRNAEEFLHDDVHHLGDHEKASIFAFLDDDPLRYAFGTGAEVPWRGALNDDAHMRWEAHPIQTTAADYVLERYLISGTEQRRDMVLQIDSRRGWMVVHSSVSNPPNVLLRDVVVTPRHFDGTDTWYPAEVIQTGYASAASDLAFVVHMKVSDLRFSNWSDQQFTAATFRLPEGTHLIVQSADGVPTSFVQTADGLRQYVSPQRHARAPSASVRRHYGWWMIAGTALLILAFSYYLVRQRQTSCRRNT